MTDPPLLACYRTLLDAPAWQRADERTRWVMDRPAYDQLRGDAVTSEAEKLRARAHADAWVAYGPGTPYSVCPVCSSAGFGSTAELSAHMQALSDPEHREPDPRDMLFAIRIVVRDDGGQPHLETPGGTDEH